MRNKLLYVSGLPTAVTEGELQELFAAHGTVESANVVTDEITGHSRGFGFIEMSSVEEAQKASVALHGTKLVGGTLGITLLVGTLG